MSERDKRINKLEDNYWWSCKQALIRSGYNPEWVDQEIDHWREMSHNQELMDSFDEVDKDGNRTPGRAVFITKIFNHHLKKAIEHKDE